MKPYYDHAGITIYHRDCREVLPTLEPVDLVLTDPPYGTEDLGRGYGRRQLHDPNGRLGRTIQGDKDLSIATEALKLCAIETGYVGMFASPVKFKEALAIVPGEYMGEIIWLKGAPGLGYTIRYAHESCLLFRVGKPAKPETALLSIVNAPRHTGSAHLKHPHEKPVAFWLRLLGLPGDVILDPFMGSGNVLRAAKDLGRRAIGIEIEERYCEIAANRLSQEVLDFGG